MRKNHKKHSLPGKLRKSVDEVSQKMLGLALGGGAYRGVAHLGVLKAFEEEGLKPGFLS